jgi:hypothetical protein
MEITMVVGHIVDGDFEDFPLHRTLDYIQFFGPFQDRSGRFLAAS